MSNPNDLIRDTILRHLYKLHTSARGPKGVGTKIRDLHRAMKAKGISQKQVNSNLDYLVQKGWVREVVTSRSYTTPQGMTQQSEIRIYKISDIGIDKLEAASIYRREERLSGINVTNIQGVTVIGSENIVNTQFSDLSRALAELEKVISESDALSDEDKLNVIADIGSLQSQLSKPKPIRDLVRTLWSGIEKVVTAAAFADVVTKVAGLMGPFFR